ncbi:VanZ family protein [Amycolatopsis orientalis]|uniref:VanZ family protein n=1 Tax=Amycolatopsis orientalis TaxID=31958 RepID=UPI0009F395A1|nr:VanZ family protein [Amycolatopsis orientalis]
MLVGSARKRRILWALAGLSLLPVFALTLVPTANRIDGILCTVQFAMPTLGTVELLANVALFLPLAYFATLATRRPLTTLAAGSGLSAVIEALQALVPAIGRACDTNDWLMNTVGAVLGVLLTLGTGRLVRRSQSGSSTGAMSS